MPGSCLESTKPGTFVSERRKARIPTGHADKEKQAPQIHHDSLAFGAKSFPDLHLAICQASSTVGDLVSSLKVGLKPPGSKLWCLCCSCCCNDMEPEPTVCWGTGVVVAPQHYRHFVVSSPPAHHPREAPWLWSWRGQTPENPGWAWGCSLPPLQSFPQLLAEGRRRREGWEGEERGPSFTDSDGRLLLVAKLNQEHHAFSRCERNATTNTVSFPLPRGMLPSCRAGTMTQAAQPHLWWHWWDNLPDALTLTRPTWALQTLLHEAFHHKKRENQKPKPNPTSQSPLHLHWFIHPCSISNRPRHEESRKLHDDDDPLRLCFPSACQGRVPGENLWQTVMRVHEVWAGPLVKL